MGSPKALLVWRGKTFLGHVLSLLAGAGVDDVRVVVGAWAAGRPSPPEPCLVVENPRPQDGPVSSIRLALASRASDASFAVVAQVDHPAVRPSTVLGLVELARRRQGHVVIPTHEGRGGHPVAIPREIFPVLLDPKTPSLRDAIAAYPRDRVHRWACGDPGVLVDVDTPEDLERLMGSSA